MKVRFSRQARNDLADIARYLAEHNPERARPYVEELRTACLEIGHMPHAFAVIEGSELANIRRRVFRPHLIFYRAEDGKVDILRIIHGTRNYLRILEKK